MIKLSLKIYTLLLVPFLTIGTFAQSTQGTRPNIILIFADDLGFADVGFNRVAGSPAEYEKYGVIPTPALDNLAANGVIMSSAHVAHPFCGPSRAALMTGVYPHRIGAQYNLPHEVDATQGVTSTETFISTVLQANDNYNTAMFGKWHLGYASEFTPNNRGFDHFFGFLGGGHDYFESSYEDNFWNKQGTANPVTNQYTVALTRNANYVLPGEFEQDEYLTNVLTEQAVNYIDSLSTAGSSDPFFIYMAYNAPHTPLEAPQADIDKFKIDNPNFESLVATSPDILDAKIPDNWGGTVAEFRASLVQDRITYATMVTIMDKGIGDIKQALVANQALYNNGVNDNTLIVFLSDNGGKLRQAGAVNYPLTQGKGSVDEGGHRVPMLMNWPAKIPGGQTYAHLVSSIDLYPTFVNLAGATIPPGKRLEGTDIMDKLILGQDARVDEPLYVMRPQGTGDNCSDGFQNVSIKQGTWKTIKKAGASWKLYEMDPNGTNDIEELNDLSNSLSNPDGQTIIDGLVEKAVLWVKDFKDVKPGWFDNEEDNNHFIMWQDGRMPLYNVTFGSSPNASELAIDPNFAQVKVTGVNDAIEGDTDGLFTVSLPGCLKASGDIDITFIVTGNATEGDDYTALASHTIKILDGMNSADINILVPTDDGENEGSEKVIITLDTTTFGNIDSTPAEINILDVPDLVAGDIAIVGWKAGSGSGELAFMLLKNIKATTKLSISNKTWNGSGWNGPYGVDDVWTWTPGAAFSVGDIFKLDSDGSVKRVIGNAEVVVGTTTQDDPAIDGDGDFDITTGGDGILIFHVDPFALPDNPNSSVWITGLNTTSGGWGTGGGNTRCDLPAALTNGDHANAVGNDQNSGVYIGPLTGTVSQLRASINNNANWATHATTNFKLWAFNETSVGIAGEIGTAGTLTTKHISNINLSIFPNPTHDYFNLTFGKTYNKVEIEILSITGKLIKTVSPNSSNPKIDATDLQSGMYIFRAKADNDLTIEKVIKL